MVYRIWKAIAVRTVATQVAQDSSVKAPLGGMGDSCPLELEPRGGSESVISIEVFKWRKGWSS